MNMTGPRGYRRSEVAHMTEMQRHEWWENEAKADYRRYAGAECNDLGPEIPVAKGKVRCHGLRKTMSAHGRWEDEVADHWYRQGGFVR